MRQVSGEFMVATEGQGLYEVTERIAQWLGTESAGDGLLTVYIPHTSASLLIQENADPDVAADLADHFAAAAPEDPARYRHTTEGPDDMPAHIRAALTQTHLAVPVRGGRMALGTWQGVFLFEHRAAPNRRRILLHLVDG